MIRQMPTCQRIRKALVILAFLSFPITMNFLSPYVIIKAAQQGIVNGSLVLFALIFFSSLWWGAPGAAGFAHIQFVDPIAPPCYP